MLYGLMLSKLNKSNRRLTFVWWCCPPFPRNRDVEELHGNPTLGPICKVWTKDEISRAINTCQRDSDPGTQDSPEGGDSKPAVDDQRRCKRNSSVLSCIGDKTKEGCDCGSEDGNSSQQTR